MARQFFGTDGIRGTVGQAPITPDFVLRLGHAVGRVLRRSEERPTVLIGKDTRISGYMLEAALESGFNSAGVDVVLLGPLPTPGVAYLTRAQRASLGVVISASHNPFADNGIKFFSAAGSKLPDEWELAVEAALDEPPVWVDSANLGKARRLDDAAGRYIEFCKSTFSNDLTLKGLRIVVDAAHGAAYQIAPKVFHELGADVVAIGPGLGQREWGRSALRTVESFNKPMVWDADALNLLAFNPDKRHNRVLTPHPGEAARLLNVSVAEIESDRLLSAQRLVKRYGGVVVLKGAGTVVASESGAMGIIDAGNAGMASGGMGDVLTGIIAALLGQHLTPYDAACAGCVAHGDAADRLAAREGTRGMLATDLFSTLRRVVNPDVIDVDHD